MSFHYTWVLWAGAFLVPWFALYLGNPSMRRVMVRTSLVTAVFGLTEPIFVPSYWLPPSLFDLAQRTRFDIESFIFSFAIGGIGVVLYNALTRTHLTPFPATSHAEPLHRFHRIALAVPALAFLPLALLPWNAIYAAIVALVVGSIASLACRPSLLRRTFLGGMLFLALYSLFMFGLSLSAPGYIAQVWNLPALSGVLLRDIPLEEFLFGMAFGLYWSSVYEHLTWTHSVAHVARPSITRVATHTGVRGPPASGDK